MPTPSLIIPSAPVYGEGLLYGLNVYGTNFVPEPIPFTRATTATRTNAAGLIELAPYNLAQWSEQLDNAFYGKINVSVSPNMATSPSGTATADKLVPNTTAGNHVFRLNTTPLGLVPGTVACISIYVKALEYSIIRIGTNASGSTGATFNLLTSVISNNTAIDANIQNIGDGWYRCSVTGSVGSAMDTLLVDNSGNTFFAGNDSDGILLWGAQVVEGTDALPYLKTETRLNRPRVDFSVGGCPNLLLEPQRTNLALYSEQFDNAAWFKNRVTTTSNTTVSPSGVGNADQINETATIGNHSIYISGGTPVTSGVLYSASIYVKKGNQRYCGLEAFLNATTGAIAFFDLDNGVLVYQFAQGPGYSISNPSITSVGNGWYRLQATFTFGTSAFPGICMSQSLWSTGTSYNNTYLGDPSNFTYIWGGQFEAGAYATSYIPTTTTSVTRNADSFTESNVFSRGMITAVGGTWFVELRDNRFLTRDSVGGIWVGDNATAGTLGNAFTIRHGGGSQRLSIGKTISGSFTFLFTTTTDTCKIAIKWNGSTADIFQNGVKVIAATAFTITNMDFLVGNGNDVPKYINQMSLYPTPLSDSELISMTTI